MKLLNTNIKQGNAKLDKALKLGLDRYRPANLTLLPTHEICPAAKSNGCFDSCLKSAGRGAMHSVTAARQAKTDYWLNDTAAFTEQLIGELAAFDKLCAKTNKIGAVRLNVLSDIRWEAYIDLEAFKNIQFYDYTKLTRRFKYNIPSNYHLTFSYSNGRFIDSDKYCETIKDLKDKGVNIAVVFNGSLPISFLGTEVIDGDKHDLRFLDKPGSVVGLTAKGKLAKSDNYFVVNNGTY